MSVPARTDALAVPPGRQEHAVRSAMSSAAGPLRIRTPLDYRRYATFSWDWAWRRSVLFGAVGVLFGASNGTTNGIMLDDWRIGIASGLVTTAIALMLVSVGPLTAAWVRSRKWPIAREKAGIVSAVLLGVAAGHCGQWIGREFGRLVVLPHAMRVAEVSPSYLARLNAVNASSIVWIASTIVFFLTSGGLALRTYLDEQRRGVEAAREREVGELQLQKRQADLHLLVLQAGGAVACVDIPYESADRAHDEDRIA